MKKLGQALLIVVIAFLIAFVAWAFTSPATNQEQPAAQTAEQSHAGHNHNAQSAMGVTPTELKDAGFITLDPMLTDHVIGSNDAPVTIIEYASLSCGHCATFHKDVLPTLKEQLLDTGKAKLIIRDFPLNASALMATKLARCVPAKRYKGMIDMLFKSQNRWATSGDIEQSLAQIGKLAGLTDDEFHACQTDETLENALLKSAQQAAEAYDINSTPSFIFLGNGNAQKISGVHPVENFTAIVDTLSE